MTKDLTVRTPDVSLLPEPVITSIADMQIRTEDLVAIRALATEVQLEKEVGQLLAQIEDLEQQR